MVEQTLAVKQLPRHYSDPVNTDRLLNPRPSIRLCPMSKERKVESANAWSPTLLRGQKAILALVVRAVSSSYGGRWDELGLLTSRLVDQRKPITTVSVKYAWHREW